MFIKMIYFFVSCYDNLFLMFRYFLFSDCMLVKNGGIFCFVFLSKCFKFSNIDFFVIEKSIVSRMYRYNIVISFIILNVYVMWYIDFFVDKRCGCFIIFIAISFINFMDWNGRKYIIDLYMYISCNNLNLYIMLYR